jgi:hypothetical protein
MGGWHSRGRGSRSSALSVVREKRLFQGAGKVKHVLGVAACVRPAEVTSDNPATPDTLPGLDGRLSGTRHCTFPFLLTLESQSLRSRSLKLIVLVRPVLNHVAPRGTPRM